MTRDESVEPCCAADAVVPRGIVVKNDGYSFFGILEAAQLRPVEGEGDEFPDPLRYEHESREERAGKGIHRVFFPACHGYDNEVAVKLGLGCLKGDIHDAHPLQALLPDRVRSGGGHGLEHGDIEARQHRPEFGVCQCHRHGHCADEGVYSWTPVFRHEIGLYDLVGAAIAQFRVLEPGAEDSHYIGAPCLYFPYEGVHVGEVAVKPVCLVEPDSYGRFGLIEAFPEVPFRVAHMSQIGVVDALLRDGLRFSHGAFFSPASAR